MSLQPAEVVLGVAFVLVAGHPLAVLLHELGHAAVPLARSEAEVEVHLGINPRWGLTLGRLRVAATFAGYSPFAGLPGFFRYRDGSLGRAELIATCLAGPAVTLALLVGTLLCRPAVADATGVTLTVLAYSLGFQLLVTLAPIEYPDSRGAYGSSPSDGRRALDAHHDEG